MSKKKIEMMVATLFLARDIAHREHLKTTGPGSYARHIALGDFYSSIVDMADELTETYQGVFNVLLDIPLATQDSKLSIIDTLDGQFEYIHRERYDAVPREWTCLHNIIDTIEAQYAKTLYKLRTLS